MNARKVTRVGPLEDRHIVHFAQSYVYSLAKATGNLPRAGTKLKSRLEEWPWQRRWFMLARSRGCKGNLNMRFSPSSAVGAKTIRGEFKITQLRRGTDIKITWIEHLRYDA